MEISQYNRYVIAFLALAISILFVYMLRDFASAIFMAAIFSGLIYPLYQRFCKWFKGRRSWASLLSVIVLFSAILLPTFIVLMVIVEQAKSIAKESFTSINVTELEQALEQSDLETAELLSVPWYQELLKYQDAILAKLAELVKDFSQFLIDSLSGFSSGAANFMLLLFVFAFSVFYFLIEGKQYLDKIFHFLPFTRDEKTRLLARFTQVTKATINGTVLLNMIQGVVGAIGMYVAGVPFALFWGLVLAIASIIPGLGTMSVWGPASIYLFMQGDSVAGTGLLLYGFLVISKVDNILRPKLVGKSAGLPDIVIFYSTLGGLATFGVSGAISGPVIAAIFFFIWGVYDTSFSQVLPSLAKQTEDSSAKQDMTPK